MARQRPDSINRCQRCTRQDNERWFRRANLYILQLCGLPRHIRTILWLALLRLPPWIPWIWLLSPSGSYQFRRNIILDRPRRQDLQGLNRRLTTVSKPHGKHSFLGRKNNVINLFIIFFSTVFSFGLFVDSWCFYFSFFSLCFLPAAQQDSRLTDGLGCLPKLYAL